MELIIDTSVFVALAINEPIAEKIRSVIKEADSVAYSVVTLVEAYPVVLRKGLKKFKPEDRSKAIEILNENYDILAALFNPVSLNRQISQRAGKLALEYWEDNMSYVDCIIAATAEHLKKTILTLDSGFSRMKEAESIVIDWKADL